MKNLIEIISPEKFRELADWIDIVDSERGTNGDEVQRDLRLFADELEKAELKSIRILPKTPKNI